MSHLIRSMIMTLILAIILCGVYPMAVWIVGNVLFHKSATGGILYSNGRPVGARLIGQSFTKPEYFHGRPSAAGNGYDAANSSGSNLGPTNKKLADRVSTDIQRLLKENPTLVKGQIPVEMVTASGSGLDPHISPAAATAQIRRVAQARGLDPTVVQELVRKHTEGPQLGLLGEPMVNVLSLNLALDNNSRSYP